MVDPHYFDREYFEGPTKATATDMLRGQHGDPVAFATADLLVEVLKLTEEDATLDVGCGRGSVVGALRERHRVEAHGFDVSRSAIDYAQDNYDWRNFWSSDVTERWLLHNDTFRLVYSIEVLEHLPENRIRHVMSEAFRVLKPGGHLVCSIATDHDLERVEKILEHHPEQRDESHVTKKSSFWWIETGCGAGFEFDSWLTAQLSATPVKMTCSPYHSYIDRGTEWSPLDDSPFELHGEFRWTLFAWEKPKS